MNYTYKKEIEQVTRKHKDLLAKLCGKTILITGASGMVGSYLVDVLLMANELYKYDIKVLALVRTREKAEKRFSEYKEKAQFNIIFHDITKKLEREQIGKVDYLIHAASNTHPKEYSTDPVGTILTNVVGMMNTYEYVRQYCSCCRVVCMSSVEIYGENNADKEIFSEEDCGYINSNTLRAGYPESKRLCEAMAQAYGKQYSIETVIPRLSRIYGPTVEGDDSKALTQFIRNAVKGKSIVLKSKGDQVFSYTYISDAVAAVLQIMLNGKTGEAYNVASPIENMCLRDIVYYLAKKCGTEVIFEMPDQVEAVGYSRATKAVLNTEKIEKELGWRAEYNLKVGLDRTITMLKAGANDRTDG